MTGRAATCMHVCDWLDICVFMRQQPPHVSSIAAADEHIIRLLQRSGLGCRGGGGGGARAVQVAVTVLSLLSGGSGSPLSEGINLLFGLLYF